jgi:Predicted symporter
MKGITYTQVAQYCVLISGYLAPAIFMSIIITGNPIPQFGFGDRLIDQDIYLLEKLDLIMTDIGFKPYTSGLKETIDVFCITAALML